MKFGRYHTLEELGRGAMGVVYKAHDPQIDRMVALKVLREDRVTSQQIVHRFLKEAMAIGRLSHPHIVTVYDVGKDHGTVYIAEEFIEGQPLNRVIGRKPFSPQDVLRIGIQIAEALDYAHRKGIVHRDIKSYNIIYSPGGRIKITDFGIAHIEDPDAENQTRAGEILGTPAYMAPEQIRGGAVDGRADIFSAGVILYELSTGKRPFTGRNMAAVFTAIVQGKAQPPGIVEPALPDHLSDLIMKCLSKRPEDRFQTGEKMAAAFRDALNAPQSGRTGGKMRLRKATGALLMLLAATLLIAGGTAGYLYFTTHSPQTPVAEPSQPTIPGPVKPAADIPVTALFTVRSQPAGADVFLDSKPQGKTPLTVSIPLGKHLLELRRNDFYHWQETIEVTEAGEASMTVKLKPIIF